MHRRGVERILAAMHAYGSVEYALDVADRLAHRGIRRFEADLAFLPENEGKGVLRQIATDGCRASVVYDDGVPRAFAVWRVMEMLAVGKHVYVDDLVTDASVRSRGYGKAMLDWLKAEAKRLGCARLQLDSGTARKDAHAFYLREGLRIEAFHFGIALG